MAVFCDGRFMSHRRRHADHERDHGHRPGDAHVHGLGHVHAGVGAVRWTGRIAHFVRPHAHDAAARVDAEMESSAEGMRTLWVSSGVLGATTLVQILVVALSGSVALLGDALHNAADSLTSLPLGIAFLIGRRPPTRRYTYGYGRGEDLAGIVIVAVIVLSSAAAALAAIQRLTHPHQISHLTAVAAAALVGFAGNELVAGFRIKVGR